MSLMACQSISGRGASEVTAAPAIRQEAKNTVMLTKAQMDKGIYVRVLDSPRLTGALRAQLSAAGLKVVDAENESGAIWKVSALYTYQRPNLEPKAVNFARAYEIAADNLESSSVSSTSWDSVSVDKSALEAANVDLNAKSGVFGQVVNGILSVSRFGAWFNEKLTGDPRGWCLGGCDRINDYKQEMVWVGRVLTDNNEEPMQSQYLVGVIDGLLRPSEMMVQAMSGTVGLVKVEE